MLSIFLNHGISSTIINKAFNCISLTFSTSVLTPSPNQRTVFTHHHLLNHHPLYSTNYPTEFLPHSMRCHQTLIILIPTLHLPLWPLYFKPITLFQQEHNVSWRSSIISSTQACCSPWCDLIWYISSILLSFPISSNCCVLHNTLPMWFYSSSTVLYLHLLQSDHLWLISLFHPLFGGTNSINVISCPTPCHRPFLCSLRHSLQFRTFLWSPFSNPDKALSWPVEFTYSLSLHSLQSAKYLQHFFSLSKMFTICSFCFLPFRSPPAFRMETRIN